MKRKILSILFSGILVLGVTGCNSSSNYNKITDDLNAMINKMEEAGMDYHVSDIQRFFKNNSNYQLIDGDSKEFTEEPTSATNKYTSVEASGQLINTRSHYVLIYDTETKTYYSVTVGYNSYKPIFGKAVKLD